MYVISVKKEGKKSYVKVDMETGKGTPVDDSKDATLLPNKMVAKAILSIIRPVIMEADPMVKLDTEFVLSR